LVSPNKNFFDKMPIIPNKSLSFSQVDYQNTPLQVYIKWPNSSRIDSIVASVNSTVLSVKHQLVSLVCISGPPLLSHNGRLLKDSDALGDYQTGCHPLFLNVSGVLCGGKGGFGSMLRAQGGKMSSRRGTNFDDCRDLNGRRLRTVRAARELTASILGTRSLAAAKQPNKKKSNSQKMIKNEEKLAESTIASDNLGDEFRKKICTSVIETLTDVTKKQQLSTGIEETQIEPVKKPNTNILAHWDDCSDISDSEKE
jgi:Silencing defective 2 N-terminal ubiquitin domain